MISSEIAQATIALQTASRETIHTQDICACLCAENLGPYIMEQGQGNELLPIGWLVVLSNQLA